ncbi:MAG: type I DNA topoisomerase [Chitinophagales bacterium]
MSKKLVIVESPSKAKTIQKYLGDDYIIESSYGHIRDLPKKDVSIDVENNFEPNYQVTADKKDVVKKLKAAAKKVDEVLLATDEDREGEAISWHLCHVLGLDPKTAKRITYTEITKTAILNAIENPRKLRMGQVDAQQARRVIDRLVGYELSPVLWKKIKPSLSAGRVQSVAVRLIVEREREIMHFKTESFFKVSALFDIEDTKGKIVLLKADLAKKFKTEKEANDFLKKCQESDFSIADITKKPAKRNPAAPFTTSTLQQEASRKLYFSVAKTMQVAQKLYESGKITYMRTDSVNLSQTAIDGAKKAIIEDYGKEYSFPRVFKTKNKDAQEAHEAIRPTDFTENEAGSNADEKRLYDLIWKRSIASQMSPAQLERTVVTIDISKAEETLAAKGEVMIFDGFLKVYLEGKDEDDEDEDTSGMLPPLSEGQVLDLNEMTATERFTKASARFTEASLVKKLEELGIGRPSTYAPTISTIQKRFYVEKTSREGKKRDYQVLSLKAGKIKSEVASENVGAENMKLFPTDIGMVVTDFLVEHFDEVMNYSFTAQMEESFDKIADGSASWTELVGKFYTPFHKTVAHTTEHADRASGERALGDDPKTGLPIIARMGKYGPMVQLGVTDEEAGKKAKFAKLLREQHLETITLEEALELFKLPRELGQFEDKVVKASIGRFGPYVMHNSKFVSITKDSGLDPYKITLEEAVDLIHAKRKSDAEKHIMSFPEHEIEVLNGRWGPYIKKGKTNYKIPKDTDAKTLDLEQVLHIMENQPPKRGKKAATKTKAATKAKAKPKAKAKAKPKTTKKK